MQHILIDKRVEGLADLVKQNRDQSTIKFDIWQKRPELIKIMQSSSDANIGIFHLAKYFLTVVEVAQKNEQYNQVVEVQIGNDCNWQQDGFKEQRTNKSEDKNNFLCWKFELHLDRFPFKSIWSSLVDRKEYFTGAELIDD